MLGCDGKLNDVSVLPWCSKSRKWVKSKGVCPLFGFCGGVVVVLWWGCKGFGGEKLRIFDLE